MAPASEKTASPSTQADQGCPVCIKAGLPLLLVRPGIAPKRYADSVSDAISPLLKDTADTVPLTSGHAGYAARTLRAGYVMVYYETPTTATAAAQDGWDAFRVDANGCLMPQIIPTGPGAGPHIPPGADKGFSCNREAAYASAMLLVIPRAKEAGKVWVGFSDHLWSDSVRAHYASSTADREKRMTVVDTKGAQCDSSVPLTADFVRSNVLDYIAPPQQIPQLTGLPYPIARGRPESPDLLMTQAEWIVSQPAGQGFEISDAMVVGVPDPVGVTHELAEWRMSQSQNAVTWLQKQDDGPRKLRSAHTIQGLIKTLQAQSSKRVTSHRAADYRDDLDGERLSESHFNELKASGDLPPKAQLILRSRGQGVVQMDTADEISDDTSDLVANIRDKLDPGWQTFLDKFSDRAHQDKTIREAIDADHVAWHNSDLRRLVVRADYDTDNAHDGMAFASAVARMTAHGPQAQPSRDKYSDFLTTDINEPENLLPRAALGNHKDFFAWYGQTDQQRLSYGLIKTLFDLEGVESVMGSKADLARVVASAHAAPILAVIASTAAIIDTTGQLTAPLRERISGLASALMTTSQDAPPAILKVRAKVSDLADGWQDALAGYRQAKTGRRAQMETRTLNTAEWVESKGMHRLAETMVTAYIWTQDAPEDFGRVLGHGASAANRYVVEPVASVGSAAWQGARVAIDPQQLERKVNQSLQILKSGDAMLSIGGGILTLMAISEAAEALQTAQGEERQQAYYTLANAGLGFTGAAFETIGAAQKTLSTQAAEGAAEKAGARMLGVGGILGGFATAIAAYQTAMTAWSNFEDADYDTATADFIAAGLFMGGGFAGVIGSSAALLGIELALSLTGWGLVLIALGFAATAFAYIFDDAPLVEWAAKSIWGTGEHYGTSKQEQLALNKLMVGLRIEFGVSEWNWHNVGDALSNNAGTMGGPINPVLSGIGTDQPASDTGNRVSDITLRLIFPAADKLKWSYRIEGIRHGDGPVVLAEHTHGLATDQTRSDGESETDGHEMERDGSTITQTVRVPNDAFWQVKARVRVYRKSDGQNPVVDQTLTRSIG